MKAKCSAPNKRWLLSDYSDSQSMLLHWSYHHFVWHYICATIQHPDFLGFQSLPSSDIRLLSTSAKWLLSGPCYQQELYHLWNILIENHNFPTIKKTSYIS